MISSRIYKKQNLKKSLKKGEKEKKNLKIIKKKKKKENSTALEKTNVKVEICKRNKQCDL